MRLTGHGVSPGVGVGKAIVVRRGIRGARFRVPESLVPRELQRLDDARVKSRTQLQHIKERIASTGAAEHAYLFDAQLLMLDDPMLVERAREIVQRDRLNAESAVERALGQISSLFDRADDPYLRERKGDIGDVVGRLLMNLRAGDDPGALLKDVEGPFVLVGDEIAPSIIAQLDRRQLAAMVTDAGSWTYHTAILARSIHLPAVVGVQPATPMIAPGAIVAVDGSSGEVIVEPDADALRALQKRHEQRAAFEHSLDEYRLLPAVTADGVKIRLEANIQAPGDVKHSRELGAEGIGLFRSEFLLAEAGQMALTEEAQYRAYRRLIEGMAPGRVTVRTFDVSEAQLTSGQEGHEARAPLGLRGVRLSLTLGEIFEAQLRALLRAAAHGPLRVMFPFVSGVEELRAARAAMARAADSLRTRGISVPPVPVGVMIEVPSAALTADLLAEEADFFSIGTNDLIQYTLAVDRTDDRVSRLYEPFHPAVIRTVRTIARAARRRGLPVAVCGEIATDPVLLTLLVGFGITEFSMAPTAIPLAKRVLRRLCSGDAVAAAQRALRARSAAEVEEALKIEKARM